jgi:hypothetical protein
MRNLFAQWAGAALTLAGFACVGKTPAGAVHAPDPTKITVFYPIDGTVYGRGEAGSIQGGVMFVFISAYPTITQTSAPVNADGSFDFEIAALSDDILEIAGATDMTGMTRGDATYIRVPPLVLTPEEYVCCTSGLTTGTCQAITDAMKHARCPDVQTGASKCVTEADCFKENQRTLPIDGKNVAISSPNAQGQVDIRGTPGAGLAGYLIFLENRGKSGVGGAPSGLKARGKIITSEGKFQFNAIPARGDDEIVLEIRSLQGLRSPELSMLVPDAKLDSFDAIGGYALTPAQIGAHNNIALRLRPRGIDGFGICPDSTESPTLCFTGGLAHDMVTIDSVDYHCKGPAGLPTAKPALTGGSLPPLNRGTEGDPLTEDKRIALVIDMSASAIANDPQSDRLAAAQAFIRNMPAHDRLMVLSFGQGAKKMDMVNLLMKNKQCAVSLATGSTTIMTTDTTKVELAATNGGPADLGDRSAALAAIDTMRTRSVMGQDPDLFPAVKAAGDALKTDGLASNAYIVVITVSNPTGANGAASCSQFTDAFDSVGASVDQGFSGIPVYIIGAALANADANLTSLAQFTGGDFNNLPPPRHTTDFFDALQDTLGVIAGNYVLFYDIYVPCCFQTYDPMTDPQARKAGSITINTTVHLNGSNGSGAQMSAGQVTIRYPVAANGMTCQEMP